MFKVFLKYPQKSEETRYLTENFDEEISQKNGACRG